MLAYYYNDVFFSEIYIKIFVDLRFDQRVKAKQSVGLFDLSFDAVFEYIFSETIRSKSLIFTKPIQYQSVVLTRNRFMSDL